MTDDKDDNWTYKQQPFLTSAHPVPKRGKVNSLWQMTRQHLKLQTAAIFWLAHTLFQKEAESNSLWQMTKTTFELTNSSHLLTSAHNVTRRGGVKFLMTDDKDDSWAYKHLWTRAHTVPRRSVSNSLWQMTKMIFENTNSSHLWTSAHTVPRRSVSNSFWQMTKMIFELTNSSHLWTREHTVPRSDESYSLWQMTKTIFEPTNIAIFEPGHTLSQEDAGQIPYNKWQRRCMPTFWNRAHTVPRRGESNCHMTKTSFDPEHTLSQK